MPKRTKLKPIEPKKNKITAEVLDKEYKVLRYLALKPHEPGDINDPVYKKRMEEKVRAYNLYVKGISHIHFEGVDPIDWQHIALKDAPVKPETASPFEDIACKQLLEHTPTITEKILPIGKKKQLEDIVLQARLQDINYNQKMLEQYLIESRRWVAEQELARKILNKKADLSTLRMVLDTQSQLHEVHPLLEYSKLDINSEKDLVVTVNVFSISVVPTFSKSIGADGDMVVFELSPELHNDLYQDYVCSVALRFIREIFAVLPFDNLIVNTVDDIVDPSTGTTELKTLLSVVASRAIYKSLSFENLEPLDGVEKFKHRMNFDKTKGFTPVTPYKYVWEEDNL